MSVKRLLTEKQHQILYEEYHKFLNTGKRNKVKYQLTDFYKLLRNKYKDFKKFTNRELTNQIIASRRVEGIEEWPNISDIQNYISPYIRNLVEKSHKSALLAVEIYNKPLIEYRTEGFLVMIMIAWTSLFHAIFLNEDKKIKYNTNDDEYIDLRKCIRKYDGYLKKEISANLNLLIEIRDRIVHRDNPILDDRLFGHCQACLLNFEEILIKYFGVKYQLRNFLAFSLQFSKKYSSEQYKSIKKYKNRYYYNILDFIKEYEDSLYNSAPEIFKSQHYSFRIYMVPKPVKENRAEAAIEYINYDTTNEESIDKMEKVICLIKETRVGGNYYKAGEVSKIIYEKLKDKMSPDWKFSPSSHHPRCTKYFKIREGYKTDKPERTKKEYCIYDPVFEQYIYTKQWIDFLVKKLKNIKLYKTIMKTRLG